MNCTKEESKKLVEKFSEREFSKIQSIDFPILIENPITLNRCENEIVSLIDSTKSSKTISPTIKYFHKSIITANRKGKMSPYDGWQYIKSNKDAFKKFYENRLRCSDWFKEKNGENMKYLSEGYVPEFIYGIGLTTSGMYPVVTYFKPHLGKYIVEKYLKEFDTVFDPFSGYSGRMIGVLCSGKNYIGRDLCVDSVKESKEIYEFMKPILSNKFENVPICDLGIADAITNSGEYDCLLTCSPYNNIEEWKGVESKNYSCDKWIDICLENYKCKKYVFVVDNTIEKYKDNVVETLVNTSHWGKNDEKIVLIER